MGKFGEKFREERERRGFTLDDISAVTKINPRMLQAIEQEQFTLLPGGVFNKGFVRAYAKHLGFSPDDAVAEYLTALRQAQIDAATGSWDQPSPYSSAASNPNPVVEMAPPPAVPETKLDESGSHSSSLNWTNARHAAPPPTSPRPTSPPPSSLQHSSAQRPPHPESPSQRATGLHPTAKELPLPRPLIQPPPQTASLPQPAPPSPQDTQVITSPVPSPPPPLWTPPPAIAKTSSPLPPPPSPLAVEPPALEPQVNQDQQISPQIISQEQLPGGRDLDEVIPIATPVRRKASNATSSSPAPANSAPWKIPSLILIVAAFLIATLLITRHSHSSAAKVAEPAAVTSSSSSAASSSSAGVQAGAVPYSAPSSSAAPNPSAATASPIAKRRGKASEGGSTHSVAPKSARRTSRVPAVNTGSRQAHQSPFRLSIRASQNCTISITADGELVARETLIAPANTTVKATREIVVQVSNASAVNFRVNDRTIQIRDTQNSAKTLVFNSTGLRPATGN